MRDVKIAETAGATSASSGGGAATAGLTGGSGAAAPAGNSGGWLSSAGQWAAAPFRAAGNVAANTVRGIGTMAKGVANTAAGGIGTAIGAVGGGLATAGGYATDAVGLTENAGASNWEGTKAFTGTMANAALQGIKDTAGGAADTATGGMYDYDGGLFTPKATAVDQMRQEHVQQLGEGSTAANIYGAANTVGDVAAEWSVPTMGFGKAVNAVNAARGVTTAAKAPTLLNTAVSQVPARAAQTWQAAGKGTKALTVATAGGTAVDAVSRGSQIAKGEAGELPSWLESFPDADEEQAAQITQAGEQLSALPDSQKQTAATALADPESPEAQELADKGQQNYIAENMEGAPSDPQQFGGFMNTMLNQFNAMPMEAKIGMGLGLAGGVMSLMQALNGGGIGNFLMGALGIGGAGALAGAGGLLGADAQKLVGDGMLGLGRAFGMELPEKTDLSALLADDPIAAAKGQGGKDLGFWSSSDDLNAAVAGAEEKKKQLEQLQSVPTWLRPMVLRSIDPDNIKTVEDANRATTNAQQVYNQLNNPESAVNQDLDNARWAANFRWYNPTSWWASNNEKTSTALTRALNKYAFNAVDAKELHDLKHEQSKKYDLDNARRLNELSMRKQQQSSSQQSFCAPQTAAPAIRSISITVLRKAARCWAGYEPVPGAKPYSRGSCRPVGSKKTQKEMKKT